MGDFGRDITGIAMAFIGVAFAALLVGHSQGTTAIIQSASSGFNSLLQTVSLQGGNGSNSLGNFGMGASQIYGG